MPPRTTFELDQMIQTALETPIHRFLGLSLISREPGIAVLEFAVGDHAATPSDTLHGGVLSLTMEPAVYVALLPLIEGDRVPTTIDFHSQPMRPVMRGETVRLVARVLRHGRRNAFCEVEARVGDDLRAKAQILKALVPTP